MGSSAPSSPTSALPGCRPVWAFLSILRPVTYGTEAISPLAEKTSFPPFTLPINSNKVALLPYGDRVSHPRSRWDLPQYVWTCLG